MRMGRNASRPRNSAIGSISIVRLSGSKRRALNGEILAFVKSMPSGSMMEMLMF